VECEVCGNESDDTFQVVRHVGRHTFDTFECAIFAMAPVCAHCGVRVIGHPVMDEDHTFCCSHCADAGPRQREEPEGEAPTAEGAEEEDEGEDMAEEDEEAAEAAEDEEEDEEQEEERDEGDEGEPSDDDLERLDERISQARQGADDLITSPEDEEEEEEEGDEEESDEGQGGDGDQEEEEG
jgi:hypothetical protein